MSSQQRPNQKAPEDIDERLRIMREFRGTGCTRSEALRLLDTKALPRAMGPPMPKG